MEKGQQDTTEELTRKKGENEKNEGTRKRQMKPKNASLLHGRASLCALPPLRGRHRFRRHHYETTRGADAGNSLLLRLRRHPTSGNRNDGSANINNNRRACGNSCYTTFHRLLSSCRFSDARPVPTLFITPLTFVT